MIKLIVDNIYTKIENIPQECEMKIWNELSFEIERFGMVNTQVKHLYNRKTKKTYTGLLEYVIDIIKNMDEEFEIEDKRIEHKPNANFKLVDYIEDGDKKIKLEARPYQQEIIDRTKAREVLQSCTGSGKTFMMAALMAKFNVKPISVFADKIALCSQLKEEFEKFLGVNIGIVGGGYNQKEDITVYSIQSATEDDVKDSKMILFDECLTGDTMISINNYSQISIKDIVENKMKLKILTYNINNNTFEYNKIYNWRKISLKQKNKKLMKITVINSIQEKFSIKCTQDHKIWVNGCNKYIPADKLILGMNVMLLNDVGMISNIEYINNEEYVYDISVRKNHNFIANGIVVKNCHHLPSNTMTQISNFCKNAYYRIGVSATPWRDAGDDLLIEAALGKRDKNLAVNASKLIELGYLVPPTIYLVPIKETFKGKNYNDLYNNAIVNNEKRNITIAKIAINMIKRKNCKVLILIKNINHGEILLKLLYKYMPMETKSYEVENKNGKKQLVLVKNIEFLSGKDEETRRKAVFAAVKDGFVKLLIGSTIADEGLDLPPLDCCILAGGGKSSTRAFQRIGRVIRLYKDPVTGEEKKRAYVFDFQDATPMLRRHSRVRERLYKTEPLWDIKIFNTNLLK